LCPSCSSWLNELNLGFLHNRITLNDIKDLMTGEFEVSDPDAEQDLMEFVGQLEKIDAIFQTAHQIDS
jgi:hypothetical protein